MQGPGCEIGTRQEGLTRALLCSIELANQWPYQNVVPGVVDSAEGTFLFPCLSDIII